MNYESKIQKICDLINNSELEKAESEICELEEYKPLKLSLIYAKAMLLYAKNRNPMEVFGYIDGKVLMNTFNYSDKYIPLMELLKKINLDRNDNFNVQKFDSLSKLACGDTQIYDEIEQLCCEDDDSIEHCENIYKKIYASMDFLGTAICREYLKAKYPEVKWPSLKNIEVAANLVMLCEKMKNNNKWLVISNPVRKNYFRFIEKCLSQLGGRVKLLTDYSGNSLHEYNGYWVVSTGDCMDMLSLKSEKGIYVFKVYARNSNLELDNLECGFTGTYIDYINEIYETDCSNLINKPATKKFSIVIPARNSIYTLQHTLKTCLEQNTRADYEIILSDNSTGRNIDVYKLWEEINDDRVVYIRTPRELHLPKCFEYAFLHANGEYILSLGSDDGLLPWALDVLDDITQKYPDEKIIEWDRGFYAWPGFNERQENQFVIPKKYDTEDKKMYYKDGLDYLAEVIMRPESMYGLPLLYINSCFKRDYIRDLLEKTGRLWDGVCQDIYMGVVNCIINKRILNVEYPLAIAGMSNSSVGARANKGIVSDTEYSKYSKQARKDGCVGGYIRSYFEQLIPNTRTDTCSLYSSIMRAVSMGILDEIYIDKVIPWDKWYTYLVAELDVNDVLFERKMAQMRYCASFLGDEFLEWFDNGIYNIRLKPAPVLNREKRVGYMVGKNANGGITLDASEYGVENIYDAVRLFVKFMNEGY